MCYKESSPQREGTPVVVQEHTLGAGPGGMSEQVSGGTVSSSWPGTGACWRIRTQGQPRAFGTFSLLRPDMTLVVIFTDSSFQVIGYCYA